MLFEMLSGGTHPVGQRTSLIWPTPAAGSSNQWSRETPWKKWLKKTQKISDKCGVVIDKRLRGLIESSLESDPSNRPSTQSLEDSLLEILEVENELAAKAIRHLMSEYDELAVDAEIGGWPHLDECLHRLNAAFPDDAAFK